MQKIYDAQQTDACGRMTREGFLRFYSEAAFGRPQAVWKDLHTHGYDENMCREGEEWEEYGEEGEEGWEEGEEGGEGSD